MARGKYSPTVWTQEYNSVPRSFDRNAKGEIPVQWNDKVMEAGVEYNEETMFPNYDNEGFDSYGYSAYLKDGTFVGVCSGIDRNGYTEMDYLCMSDEDFENF